MSASLPDDSPAPREISVDQAVALAIDCLKDGRAGDAAAICRRVLDVTPGHADALHYAGMAAYSEGRVEEAIVLVRQGLERAPGQADWHSNLGIMLQAQDDLEGAIAAFQRAIDIDPAHANAHNNLGVLLRVSGRLAEAEALYRSAIALNPEHADAYHNLAIVLDLTDRPQEAATAHFKALTLQPENPNAWRQLALAYCLIGEREKAVELCEEWLVHYPGNPQALHTLAACSGRHVPPRASDAYVQEVFDSFAGSFEAKLAKLRYRAPDLVAGELAAAGIPARGDLDVLDLGCGTGLCGPRLAPYARRIVGVDLSRGMLQHALGKGVYHELVQGELTGYLEQRADAYDVIVSADTLVYFGALDAVFVAAAAALRPGGVFICTVEEALDPAPATTYELQPHGRYTHAPSYVERLLVSAGLHSTIGHAELRKESGLPVAGLVIRAAKRLA